jgi:2-phospho-L-lactate guanylyltransferase
LADSESREGQSAMSDQIQVWAAIPVKRFSAAKSRLTSILDSSERAMLARLMFEDVLDSVLRCRSDLAGAVVVTSDDDAAAIALARGAQVIGDPGEAGINAAIGRAVRHIGTTDHESMVVIPSDIPQVSPHTIAMAMRAVSAPRTLAIAAATEDGGTNLLACRPAIAMPLCFGPQSFDRHCRAALQAGLIVEQLHLANLSVDIDRPEDIAAFLRLNSKTRTHAFLADIGMRDRLEARSAIGAQAKLVVAGIRHDR